ncbi:hypothetical protein CI266_004946 [Salmonella enterica subsp. enterica serovar Kotte]|nr:hypothetical protein [Salmonella enterica subsp. enterica serovar Kotte]
MRKTLLIAAFLLAGCSSPPEPTPVEWDDTPPQQMNTQSPHWKENNTVVPAKDVTEHWSRQISRFNPAIPYVPDVFYTVTHSVKFVVFASNGTEYFKAKDWLIKNGANGTIIYRHKAADKKGTEILLIR